MKNLFAVPVDPTTFRIKDRSGEKLEGGYVSLEQMADIFASSFPYKPLGNPILSMDAEDVVLRYQWCVYNAHLSHESSTYEVRIFDRDADRVYTIGTKALARALGTDNMSADQVFVPKTWFDAALPYCQAGYYTFSKVLTSDFSRIPLEVGLPAHVRPGTDYPEELAVAYGQTADKSRLYIINVHR